MVSVALPLVGRRTPRAQPEIAPGEPPALTWQTAKEYNDAQFFADCLRNIGPSLAPAVRAEYLRRRAGDPRAANLYLLDCLDLLTRRPAIVAGVEDLADVADRAEQLARWCRRDGVVHTCAAWQLDLPAGEPGAGQERRGQDPLYWQKRLRYLAAQWWDEFHRAAGFVGSHARPYCSDRSVQWVEQRDRANLRALDQLEAVSDDCRIPLLDLFESGVANPEHRYVEMMIRCRGIQEHAERTGRDQLMLTVTAPSRMHPRRSKSNTRNPRYDGTTVRQAQDYGNRVAARILAATDRAGIRWHGCRVTEPNQDGTPHWHYLVTVPAHQARELERIFRRYALQDTPDEPGARKHRFDVLRIDERGGAGYLAKYVAKGIDGGARLEVDRDGNPLPAERVIAWRKVHQIRAFAFYGQPSVTLYREYRRQRSAPEFPHSEPWELCDRYRWADFIDHQGGEFPAELSRVTRPMRDRYGDPLQPSQKPIIGCVIGPSYLATREKKWTIQRKARGPRAASPHESLTSSTRLPACAHASSTSTSSASCASTSSSSHASKPSGSPSCGTLSAPSAAESCDPGAGDSGDWLPAWAGSRFPGGSAGEAELRNAGAAGAWTRVNNPTGADPP